MRRITCDLTCAFMEPVTAGSHNPNSIEISSPKEKWTENVMKLRWKCSCEQLLSQRVARLDHVRVDFAAPLLTAWLDAIGTILVDDQPG